MLDVNVKKKEIKNKPFVSVVGVHSKDMPALTPATTAKGEPCPTLTLTYTRMNTCFMSVDRLASLLNKAILNIGNAVIYVTGDPNEETGYVPQVILKSSRGVFSVDGVVVKAEKKVISGDRVFFVKDEPTAKDAIRAAITLIYQKEATEARLYCDDQDAAFLARIGG